MKQYATWMPCLNHHGQRVLNDSQSMSRVTKVMVIQEQTMTNTTPGNLNGIVVTLDISCHYLITLVTVRREYNLSPLVPDSRIDRIN